MMFSCLSSCLSAECLSEANPEAWQWIAQDPHLPIPDSREMSNILHITIPLIDGPSDASQTFKQKKEALMNNVSLVFNE